MLIRYAFSVILFSLLTLWAPTFACTTIIVGSQASQTGSIIIARNDDHNPLIGQHVIVHPVRHYLKTQYFHSNVNHFKYPEPKQTLKYIAIPSYGTHDLSHEEAGINQLNIGISATETIYNKGKVLAIDPYVTQNGINEDSIASVLLPRIHSAKQGIELLGHIIETQGTAEGFGVAIGDTHQVWYLETASGHRWAAIRIPANQVLVAANQSRLQHLNLKDNHNFLASPGLIQFAIAHKLYSPKQGPFNFRLVFGQINANDKTYNYPRLAALFKLYSPDTPFDQEKGNFPTLFKPKHPLSVLDVIHGLQNHYQLTPHDPYQHQNPSEKWRPISVFRTMNSHVITLSPKQAQPIAGVLYVAMGMSTLSAYVPFFSGISQTPRAYHLGTDQADNVSAFWAFRKMQTVTMLNYPQFGQTVHNQLNHFQQRLIAEVAKTKQSYIKNPNRALLQRSTFQFSAQAIQLANSLTNQMLTQLANNINTTYRFEGA